MLISSMKSHLHCRVAAQSSSIFASLIPLLAPFQFKPSAWWMVSPSNCSAITACSVTTWKWIPCCHPSISSNSSNSMYTTCQCQDLHAEPTAMARLLLALPADASLHPFLSKRVRQLFDKMLVALHCILGRLSYATTRERFALAALRSDPRRRKGLSPRDRALGQARDFFVFSWPHGSPPPLALRPTHSLFSLSARLPPAALTTAPPLVWGLPPWGRLRQLCFHLASFSPATRVSSL